MTETPTGGAVATTKGAGTQSALPASSNYGSGYKPPAPYYPRTDEVFGLKWNDGEVTLPAVSTTPDDALKLYMNSIKLRRVGVYSPDFYPVGVVTGKVEKPSSLVHDWKYSEWEIYKPTREDMLKLLKAG